MIYEAIALLSFLGGVVTLLYNTKQDYHKQRARDKARDRALRAQERRVIKEYYGQ